MEENQSFPKKNKLGALAFLEVGIFELFFVVVTLAIFFGIMNYFNILPLSQIWPNYFGFLPHREVSTGTSPHRESLRQTPNIASQPTPTTNSFADAAKQTLLSTLPTVISQQLLPTPSAISLIQEKKSNEFSTLVDSKDGSGKITFTTSSSETQIYEILIFYPYKTTDSVSVQTAEKTIPQFFSVEQKGTWGCKNLPNKTNYCENFWEENGIKRGTGMQESSPLTKDKKVFVFFCEYRKGSDKYSWKSCAEEFAQTGVQ